MEVRVDNLLSKDEFFILLSVLNEIRNGIDVFEFEARIGASKDEVKVLEEKIKKIVSQIDNVNLK